MSTQQQEELRDRLKALQRATGVQGDTAAAQVATARQWGMLEKIRQQRDSRLEGFRWGSVSFWRDKIRECFLTMKAKRAAAVASEWQEKCRISQEQQAIECKQHVEQQKQHAA